MFFIDGTYVTEKEAKIAVLDLSLLRGFGVFDYLRTYGLKPFHLWEHLLRFKFSAQILGLTLPYSLEEIVAIVDKVVALSHLPEASVKIVLTGGVSADQLTPENQGSLIVFAYPLKSPPRHCYTQGVDAITTSHMRCMPTSKTTSYLPAMMALKSGAMEALYLNTAQELLEGTTSNFFGVKGDVLYTCTTEEVLAGITREVVFQLAEGRFRVETRAIHKSEISTLTEAFITASNKEIMPVVSIDGQKIGSGTVGPVTRALIDAFAAYTAQPAWPPLTISRYSPMECLHG